MHSKLLKQINSRETVIALLFLFPVIAFSAAFILFPIFGTFVNSMYRDVSYLPRAFIGLDNYSSALTSTGFWRATVFTLLFAAVAVLLELFLGLLFALLLNEKFRGRGVLRAAVLIPWAIPTIIAGRTWQVMYQYSYGVINFIFTSSGVAENNINWLGTSYSAFWAIVLADVWKTTPFVVIILLAGLQAIPGDLYKQAKVDGATMVKRFTKITLPLLSPVILVAVIFRTIDSLRIFDLVYVLTGGGPGGTTQTLSYIGYQHFNNDQFGMGSTISVIMFAISFAITIVYIKKGNFKKGIN
ncbi:sugar ABC transporter permease [Chitinispirillales bacterium ANBcel5]|uniref:carbohydrate ABC transporter permease n=1 Tax=Cellulosispirillum alkaliphilum TaxID=3039283 RepID=UPI002A51A731|nr:sugar ABC transporter permease [Chitinispirillales bacterium ANBcel5]